MAAQYDLRGKVALITGASSGIGRAADIALARNGAAIVANYFNNEKRAAEPVADSQLMRRNAMMVRADVTKRVQVAQMIVDALDNFGRIDILVNNAGSIVKLMRIEDCDDEILDAVMDVNLKSVFLCSQIVLPYMKEQRGGRIINISSLAAQVGGRGGSLPYAAAKAAVKPLTKGLAKEI